MNNKNKKGKFKILLSTIIAVFIMLMVVLGIFIGRDKHAPSDLEGFDTKPLNDAELESVYLGEINAKNDLLLVFDYSCVYCHEWMNDIFPIIEETYIESDQVKFRTQAMVYLNDQSLKLANFDQNLKRNYPELYFPIFKKMMSEYQLEDWGTEVYLKQLIYANDLEHTLLDEPKEDSLSITRKYTKALEIEGVPTVYVNGIKMENPFDLKKLKSYLD